MYPVLLSLGPFQLRAYGLALAIAFLAGSWLTLRRGRERGIPEEVLLGLFWWIILAAIVGARAFFVFGHPESFPNPLDAFRIWEGGLTQYGGLLGAMLASWIYLRRHRLSFLSNAELTAPALALGEGITRIGCFVNGCCFGRECHGTLCVHYPADSYAADALGAGVPVFPSQLILSAAFFLVTVLLLRLERRRPALGVVFALFLALQGGVRWVVDFTRYYEPVDRITSLAPVITTRSQLTAAGLLIAGLWLLFHQMRASSRAGRP